MPATVNTVANELNTFREELIMWMQMYERLAQRLQGTDRGILYASRIPVYREILLMFDLEFYTFIHDNKGKGIS